MATDNLTAIPKSKSRLKSARLGTSLSNNNHPINVINDRLDQALATLDILHTATSEGESAELFIETLSWQTLNTALYSVILRIREAQQTAGNWHSRQAAQS